MADCGWHRRQHSLKNNFHKVLNVWPVLPIIMRLGLHFHINLWSGWYRAPHKGSTRQPRRCGFLPWHYRLTYSIHTSIPMPSISNWFLFFSIMSLITKLSLKSHFVDYRYRMCNLCRHLVKPRYNESKSNGDPPICLHGKQAQVGESKSLGFQNFQSSMFHLLQCYRKFPDKSWGH